MSENKQKHFRVFYILAILLPILACVIVGTFVYLSVPELPGALDALGIKHLTQVIVPGSADVSFPKKGAYAVYYEYRSEFEGVSYNRDQYPPSLRCELRSKVTGEAHKLSPTSIEGDIYTNPERAGVVFKQISIDQPGVYTFSCQYPDGRSYPKIVMAVGPNLVWEFFNVAAKPIAAILCGAFVFCLACGISILIIIVVAIKRNQSKNRIASQA